MKIEVESDIQVIPGPEYDRSSDAATTPPQNDATPGATAGRNEGGRSNSGRRRPDGQECPPGQRCLEIDRPQGGDPARVGFSPDVVPAYLSEGQEDQSDEQEADDGPEEDWNNEWEDDWGEDLDEDWDDNWEDDLDDVDEDDDDWDEEPAGPVEPNGV